MRRLLSPGPQAVHYSSRGADKLWLCWDGSSAANNIAIEIPEPLMECLGLEENSVLRLKILHDLPVASTVRPQPSLWSVHPQETCPDESAVLLSRDGLAGVCGAGLVR